MTLDDVELDSALLDIEGKIEAAVNAAWAIDLRRVKNAKKKKLVNDVRTQGARLLDRLR